MLTLVLHLTTCSRKGLSMNVTEESQTTFYHRPEEKTAASPMIKRREHQALEEIKISK